MTEELKSVSLLDALVSRHPTYFQFDNKTQPEHDAKEGVRRAMEFYKDLEAGFNPNQDIYVIFTKGPRASPIARLKGLEVWRGTHRVQYGQPEVAHTGLIEQSTSHSYSGRTSGSYWIEGYYSFRAGKYEIVVDDRDPIAKGRHDTWDSGLEKHCHTYGLRLLLNYGGPTVWSYNRGSKADLAGGPTMLDRFDREVRKGDNVVLALSKGNMLLVGKISRISEKGTIWIRHIGSPEDHKELNVGKNQLLLLKDVEQAAMIKKLSVIA